MDGGFSSPTFLSTDWLHLMVTMSHVIKSLSNFRVFENVIHQKSEQLQSAVFWSYFIYVTQTPMLTNCIMTNLIICENFDVLSLCVLLIKRILLVLSDIPSYIEIVLVPFFPLSYVMQYVMCHVSCANCHMQWETFQVSHVMCPVLRVTCHQLCLTYHTTLLLALPAERVQKKLWL